jgi:RND family efflux transporter MFP subunit
VRKTLTHKVEGPGEVRAFEQAPIYPRISGYLLKVHKDIGNRVAEGEILAELSVPEMDAELRLKADLVVQARAEVELSKKLFQTAQATLRRSVAKIKVAEAARPRVQADLRQAESRYERLKKAPGVISAEQLEEARLGAESARAAVGEVEAQILEAEAARDESDARQARAWADVGVAEAHLRAAVSEERRYAALVDYAKLRAPFAGVVTVRNKDAGHFVQPVTADKAEPVFVVARRDPVRVFVDVPDGDAVLVRDGTPAVVRVQALKGEEFSGEVTRSAWSLDPKERTLRTEIDLKNPQDRLRPHMYAYAAITVVRADVLAVPAAAVQAQGGKTFCYLVEGGKAVRTAVHAGIKDGEWVEVLRKRKPGDDGGWEAFTGEEVVITDDLSGLTDGQAVRVAAGR